ncbi:MAG: efflux RND transporter periplasmic adaptor subunit [Vicinamibacterales bacterium]
MTLRTLALIALSAAAGACNEPPPSNSLRTSGHVEATETRLAPDAGGRILTFDLAEGTRVEAGQTVLTLDQRDVQLALERARAERAQAEANLRLLQAGARAEDIRQAESQAAAARADVAAARAELGNAEEDLQRFEQLLSSNSGSRKQRDDAATRRQVATERVAAAESRVKAAEEAVARLRAGARREELEAARARVAAVDAQIATLEKNLDDTHLESPIGGLVTEKLVEPGEVIAPRTPVAVVVDLDHAWADVFVPEPAIPRLRLGQQAQVYTDAGGAGLPGTITFISPKAEFTPRNVQTADERSKLVYACASPWTTRTGCSSSACPSKPNCPCSR